MTGIDYFALFVMLVLFITIVGGWLILAMLPGHIAKKNNHPQAGAVNIGGWMGAIFGGVFWPIVLVWSLIKSPTIYTAGSAANIDLAKENQELRERIAALEAQKDTEGKVLR